MKGILQPEPVKLFVAMLHSPGSSSAVEEAVAAMSRDWGPVDFRGDDRPFVASEYYQGEMGRGLGRRLLSFERLVSPEILAESKRRAMGIEDELRTDGRRVVNLDVGYLDLHKYVLASAKPAGQKIYLSQGIWADIQGRFREGLYQPFEWTFPDFASGSYDVDLARMRELLRTRLRALDGRGNIRS